MTERSVQHASFSIERHYPSSRERVWNAWADQNSYEMHIGKQRISVSLATIEFKVERGGTRLVMTEQGAFLDGYDDAGSRERGTGELLTALGVALAHSS